MRARAFDVARCRAMSRDVARRCVRSTRARSRAVSDGVKCLFIFPGARAKTRRDLPIARVARVARGDGGGGATNSASRVCARARRAPRARHASTDDGRRRAGEARSRSRASASASASACVCVRSTRVRVHTATRLYEERNVESRRRHGNRTNNYDETSERPNVVVVLKIQMQKRIISANHTALDRHRRHPARVSLHPTHVRAHQSPLTPSARAPAPTRSPPRVRARRSRNQPPPHPRASRTPPPRTPPREASQRPGKSPPAPPRRYHPPRSPGTPPRRRLRVE